jgi:cell division septation protein DedD
VRRAARASYRALASADGWAVFGATDKNEIVRLTPTGDWRLALERNVRRLIASPNGTLLVLIDEGDDTRILRMRPPDDVISDSTTLQRVSRAALAPLGDRAWIATGRQVHSIPPNALEERERFTASGEVIAIAPTPSGDRVFLASAGQARLELVDRYASHLRPSVLLPGPATELRMDPLGRRMLARPETGDSVWVVSVGEESVLVALPTEWRDDLPAIALDGTIATVVGDDVRFVDPRSRTGRTVAGGAADLWLFARWNGFRPRARGIDEPVSFSYERGDASTAAPDVVAPRTPPPSDTAVTRPVAPPAPSTPAEAPAPRARRWVVSFAAVLSLERAREIAATISVEGARPRIATGETAGTTVYRVVLGPYESREAAERVGRASRHSFWVFEDVP